MLFLLFSDNKVDGEAVSYGLTWQHDGAAVWGVFQEKSQIPQLIRRMMEPEPMITVTLTEVLPELDHIPTVAER